MANFYAESKSAELFNVALSVRLVNLHFSKWPPNLPSEMQETGVDVTLGFKIALNYHSIDPYRNYICFLLDLE